MQAPRPLLIGIGVVALGLGVAGTPMAAASRHWSPPALMVALGLLVGWTFTGAGLVAWWRRPRQTTLWPASPAGSERSWR